MTIAKRIAASLASKGMTRAELARACGVTKAAVTQWMSSETKALKASSIIAIANALDVSPAWLETGKGSMAAPHHISISEGELLALFRSMNEQNQSNMLAIARSLLREQSDVLPSVVSPFPTVTQ